MSQLVTVISDNNDPGGTGGQWTLSTTGNPVNVFSGCDEGFPGNDSTDYAQQGGLTSGQVGAAMIFNLTHVAAPSAGTTQIKVRHYSQDFTRTYTYELREGYTDEAHQGTLLGSVVIDPGIAGWHSDTPTFSTGAASDGANLQLRVFVTAGGAGTTISAITAVDLLLPDSTITGSGSSDVALGDSAGAGKVFWNASGSSTVVISDTGTGEDKGATATSPMQVVVGIDADSGDTVSGIVLGINNDLSLHVAVQLQPAGTGQQLRWAKEVNMDSAIVVDTIP